MGQLGWDFWQVVGSVLGLGDGVGCDFSIGWF